MQKGVVNIARVPTSENPADVFTKLLSAPLTRRHLSPCGLCQLPVGEGEEQQELQDINILLDSVVKLHIKHRQQQAAQLSAQLNNITATTDQHHQLTRLQQQQQQRSNSLDTVYINMIDTVDHLAATASRYIKRSIWHHSRRTSEEAGSWDQSNSSELQRRQQQQQQQQQRSPSEAQHQDPSPRPRRQQHQENGEEARSERGPSVTSRRSRTSSPGRQEGEERRSQEGERRIRPCRQPPTAIVAIRQRASHHRRAIMVVTSLVLSVVSSLSPVAASLPFYISEAARLSQRTSQLASHIPWDIPLHIIGNISHRVMAGTSSTASVAEEVIMVGEHLAAQPASPQPTSPQQQQQAHQHASPQQGEQPSVVPAIEKQRDIKTHLIQDIIEQRIGIFDNTAPSTDIRNIYRNFSEVYIDGHHLSFNNIDEFDLCHCIGLLCPSSIWGTHISSTTSHMGQTSIKRSTSSSAHLNIKCYLTTTSSHQWQQWHQRHPQSEVHIWVSYSILLLIWDHQVTSSLALCQSIRSHRLRNFAIVRACSFHITSQQRQQSHLDLSPSEWHQHILSQTFLWELKHICFHLRGGVKTLHLETSSVPPRNIS